MTVKITPNGTRGFKAPGAFRLLACLHARIYKLVGGRGHRNMVVLTTLGSRSGLERSSTVASFPEGEGTWLVVASMGTGGRRTGRWQRPDTVCTPRHLTTDCSRRRPGRAVPRASLIRGAIAATTKNDHFAPVVDRHRATVRAKARDRRPGDAVPLPGVTEHTA